jgi:hypothetical protein
MRTRDGIELSGNSPEEIVSDLRRRSFEQAGDNRAFMHETQGRVTLQIGKRIRCDTAEHFVDDLIKVGLLLDEPSKIVEPAKKADCVEESS